ncbi:MAG: AEC family transporter [Clostridia bacterium]|nr:AEC family transporter [Clostridia bacterium]
MVTPLIYKIAQLMVMVAIGFIVVKSKLVKSGDSMVLSKVSLYVFVPAIIVNAFNKEINAEVMSGLALALLAAVIIHGALLLVDYFFSNKLFHGSAVERASIMYSNSGNLIIPIVAYVLGNEWVIYSCVYLIVALVLTWTHEVRLFNKNEKFNIKKILLNVNMITIFFCFAIVIFGIKLPEFCYEIANDLGACLAPASMLVAGMLAADIDFKKALRNKRLIVPVFGRLVLCPIVILLLLKALMYFINMPNESEILLISFLASITPCAMTVIQMAQVYGDDVDYAVVINFATTVLCILTMPIFVALF